MIALVFFRTFQSQSPELAVYFGYFPKLKRRENKSLGGTGLGAKKRQATSAHTRKAQKQADNRKGSGI